MEKIYSNEAEQIINEVSELFSTCVNINVPFPFSLAVSKLANVANCTIAIKSENSVGFVYRGVRFTAVDNGTNIKLYPHDEISIKVNISGVDRYETEDAIIFAFKGSTRNEIFWGDVLGSHIAPLNTSSMNFECGASCFWGDNDECYIYLDKRCLDERVHMLSTTNFKHDNGEDIYGENTEENQPRNAQYNLYTDNFFHVGYVWTSSDDKYLFNRILEQSKLVSHEKNFVMKSEVR